ncbi:unnamed protein product [marine sediment metagenome]|uniref:Uncharacterized protein n=1 Tax=marine sediment metagenome TaxID=412755 RepID=X1FKL7_9ZZZZ
MEFGKWFVGKYSKSILFIIFYMSIILGTSVWIFLIITWGVDNNVGVINTVLIAFVPIYCLFAHFIITTIRDDYKEYLEDR